MTTVSNDPVSSPPILRNETTLSTQFRVKVKSSVVSDSLQPHGLYSPWNSPGQITGVGSLSLLQGISQPRDQTQVSCIAGGLSLPAESQGKPKNTGVGSLSLLQGIFPTQGLNPGLPHCRRILYHLSHQGSPWDSGEALEAIGECSSGSVTI